MRHAVAARFQVDRRKAKVLEGPHHHPCDSVGHDAAGLVYYLLQALPAREMRQWPTSAGVVTEAHTIARQLYDRERGSAAQFQPEIRVTYIAAGSSYALVRAAGPLGHHPKPNGCESCGTIGHAMSGALAPTQTARSLCDRNFDF
jgi:hypothetical protein